MKNLCISLFFILFSIAVFQADSFANTVPVEASQEMAQLQTSAAASASAQSAKARMAGEVQFEYKAPDPVDESPWKFFAQNWGVLSLAFVAFLEVGARLTPTEKDNTILKILTTIINAIVPNFRKGGGTF